MRRLLPLLLALGPTALHARPGDAGDPLRIDAVPFVHASTTVGRAAAIDRYACNAGLSEAGPEVVYVFDAPADGTLVAWVEGDADPIDVDVQVLASDRVADGTALDCLGRHNRVVEAAVQAGPVYVVVDSYEGAHRAGPYRLRVDFQAPDTWYRRELARGVTLETKHYPSLFQSVQTGSVLRVDLAEPGVVVKPITADRCATVSDLGEGAGAVAAINGGFFNRAEPCASVSLLKIDGRLVAANAVGRSAVGFDAQGAARIARVAAGADWPEVRHAVGGVPRLASGGAIDVQNAAEDTPDDLPPRNPRTAAGITAGGGLILAAVDGRTEAGAGMTLDELAQWMVWLGASEAMNLDGGGSTTLWARGEPFGGVVNHPSDNRRPDHEGERLVGHALGVWAEPLDRDARWLTAPPDVEVAAGETWAWEAVAADPEGAPVRLTGRAVALDGALSVEDRGDGTARVEVVPALADAWRGAATIEVEVAVEGSRAVTRRVEVRVTRQAPPEDAGPPPQDAAPARDAAPDGAPADAGFDAAPGDDAAPAGDAAPTGDATPTDAFPSDDAAPDGATPSPDADADAAPTDGAPPSPDARSGPVDAAPDADASAGVDAEGGGCDCGVSGAGGPGKAAALLALLALVRLRSRRR